MFSPSLDNGSANAAPTPMTTRSRRRQRPLSAENSVQQPKAKRQRVPLSEDAFANSNSNAESYEVKSAKPSVPEAKQDGIKDPPPQLPKQGLSVRSKKPRHAERLNKGDGSTLLAADNAFDVRKLPALPDRLKQDPTSRQHGLVDSSTGYALNLTHTHAVVWPYSTPTQSPESFTFTLPCPSKNTTDPLPLGALVPPSASSSEPGLVVVVPTSGRITYWESISSATTLDFLRQQRHGVEESIPGMFSGETVIQISTAESAAGFILTFSSGRIAYMSVRDAHGRPKVSVQFLRTSLGPSSGGIFGSIRHALTHAATQGDIVAVRTDGSSNQGESTVVAATSKGRLQSWRVHRGGHHDVLAEVDARTTIMNEVQQKDQISARFPSESFKVLDFCFVPHDLASRQHDMSQLVLSPTRDDQQHLLFLTYLSDKHTCRYTMVEVMITPGPSENAVEIGMVRPLSAYSTPPDSHSHAKPRLFLPRPSIIAFVVLNRAIVIASIAQPPDTPDSQLMEDNDLSPASYEDVVDLREDPTVEIVGSGGEEPHLPGPGNDEGKTHKIKTKNPSVVLLVRGAGTLRIAVPDAERFASEKPPVVTAKTKLEQAVFFGVREDSPLVFDVQRERSFTDEQFGVAALALSQDILTSTGQHFSSLAVRVETNIKERVRYLDKLIAHIQKLGISLNRVTKWKLLWNAEKMHVASTLWRKHEEFIGSRPVDSKKSIVAEIVEYIRSEEKSEPDVEKGEVDQLRHWFIRDVDRMELFIAWGYEVIKHNTRAHLDQASLTRFIYEATEIYNGAIRDALAFRQGNLACYGLGGEQLENGILAGSYDGLPIPWTCEAYLTNNIKRQLELASEWVKQNWSALQDSSHSTEAVLLQKIQEMLPQLTEIYLTSLQELSRSYLASDDPKKSTTGQQYEQIYEQDRHEKVVLLADSENWDAAIEIAEHHRSLPALAQVLTREIDGYRDQLDAPGLSPDRVAELESAMAAKETKVREYFGKYGEEFAFPFYEYLFTTYGIDALLQYDGDKKYKTMYLRTKPELAKISWINDVIVEEDTERAADTLLDLGLTREQLLWNKKIELSLGKLARLAESSRPSSKASASPQGLDINGAATDARVDAIDKELAIIGVQDDLYDTQIRPVIDNAVDEQQEWDSLQETFALKIPKKYKILSQIFDDALKRLYNHEALDALSLIDLLTLITLPPETKELIPDQFFLAIQVAYDGLSGEERVQAERLIWRRCYLREDWTRINNTSLKNDEDLMEVLSRTDLFGVYCMLYASQYSQNHKEYQRLSPSEAAGVYTDTLDRRFEKMEKGACERMLEAMRWEDSNLRKHIEKHRLEQWAIEARKMAEEAVDQQYDATTAAGALSKSPTKPKALTANSNEEQNGAD
ncbi:hypothetical protein DL768_009093 [Monosporascus sp. mg162]|nr:hypothetical protein DL768_009093 [Monosporascus sp. mg162]